MTIIATHHRTAGEESLTSSLTTDNPNIATGAKGFEENETVGGGNETDCAKRQLASVLVFGDEQVCKQVGKQVGKQVVNSMDEKVASTTDHSRVSIGPMKRDEYIPELLPASARSLKRVRARRTIPLEISCHESSASSVDSDLDLDSGSNPLSRRIAKRPLHQEACDFHNKGVCLELLESDWFEDNCVGMEHLVAIANRELVNSARFLMPCNEQTESSLVLSSTLAYSLVCNSNDDWGRGFSSRLRAAFPTYLSDSRTKRAIENNNKDDDDDDYTSKTGSESLASSISSSLLGSLSSSRSSGRGSQDSQTEDFCLKNRTSLRLPALRVLVSSLELVLRTRSTMGFKASDSPNVHFSSSSFASIDMLDDFWRSMLAYMTDCLQDLVTQRGLRVNNDKSSNGITTPCSVEAALVVKSVRLLHRLEPPMMGPHVRYILLPYVSDAHEFGKQKQGAGRSMQSPGNKMLVRECDRLLKTL